MIQDKNCTIPFANIYGNFLHTIVIHGAKTPSRRVANLCSESNRYHNDILLPLNVKDIKHINRTVKLSIKIMSISNR